MKQPDDSEFPSFEESMEYLKKMMEDQHLRLYRMERCDNEFETIDEFVTAALPEKWKENVRERFNRVL